MASDVNAAACRDVTVPIQQSAARWQVHGRLCAPSGATTIQVLVPGATYNSLYWDFPGGPSYVHDANTSGYATLAIDRLGTGQSSHPSGLALSGDLEAEVVHRLVQLLRAGQIGSKPWRRVVVMGHSMGSLITILEESRWHDADAVVLTGLLHSMPVASLLTILTRDVYPALLDPAFGLGADPLSLTTIPGRRGPAFHAAGDVDPAVVQRDEATKDVVPGKELVDVVVKGFILQAGRGITAPVMVAVGQSDGIFCAPAPGGADCSSAAALKRAEGPAYPSAASLTTFVLPGAGHDLQLARNAAAFSSAASAWIHANVPA
ncbi:alpha/beta fold hydrolase [Labedaea rhizosphaerae]|uniref:Alpha-beta hydrolase superfamily lysophospholipase n=1 Tax=Labedaea rhizosphaerae TaxID=598644 RepID=A0A4R6SF71_LABRH|nr:alpha/beta fold hydrolase [Labedaea rhizosphaerae]TDQ00622.1 alpha-beta hydrolase superfamily lysophospholipase [Labedaea rhizosphaerae]